MAPKRFQIGVKGIIVVGDHVLLLKRAGDAMGPFWETPGGRMEEGETVEETLRRELAEELPASGTSRLARSFTPPWSQTISRADPLVLPRPG
jgi:8-oxo-dGTP pyrophosphatase MutT (NUDIX family)